MSNPWPQVRRLFKRDTGDGFPDIWIEKRGTHEYLALFDWLGTLFDPPRGTLMQTGASNGALTELHELIVPPQDGEPLFLECWQETDGLVLQGVELPGLVVRFEDDAMAMVYAMGPQWGECQVRALSQLLSQLAERAPTARFGWAQEGC